MQAIRNVYRDYALAWELGDADLWLSIWDEGATPNATRFAITQQGRSARNHAAAICAGYGFIFRY